MKKASKEATDKIRKAAKEGKITYADTYTVEDYEPELDALLSIFNLKLEECFISDESRVSDFAGCGDHGLTDDQIYVSEPVDFWMTWVKNKVFLRFGVCFTENLTLVELAVEIRKLKGIVGSGLN